ncbi:MAG TPA: 5-deoxy-glucuronate isomerase [Caulobacteraceae bacterium]|nr:5-deoxy-glucuronate isomerase [Caulobacteraceae bacterium]
MTTLRVRPRSPDRAGLVTSVTPSNAGWRYVGFEVRQLRTGQVVELAYSGREACIVVLAGAADIDVGGQSFAHVGGRSSVFEDAPPGVVYAPASLPIRITAANDAEVAIGTAPGAGGGAARLIPAERMSQEVRGEGTNQRFVRNILPETEPAESLLVVEVITPAGHWSSYPPHKHDADRPPEETQLEETYYHRLDPPQGFAFQRVYTDDRTIDETICVEDGDVVLVPRGYHPVGAAHGYRLYYLNVMAGPKRRWIFKNDPRHEWMLKPR